MKVKRWFSVILAAALTVCLAACGSSDSTDSGAEAAADAYCVTLEGTTIVMNADAAPILEGLGEESSYFESESCAFEGLDKVYTYPGFKLNTYPTDDEDFVSSVVFMDDTVSTDEGICIGSSLDDVIEAYGEADEDTGAALVYEKGDSRMTIGISGDAVSSLEIAAITE